MKKYGWQIFVVIMLLAIVVFFIMTLTAEAFRGEHLVAGNASDYGSFVGGVLGTILSFVSIVLVVWTMRDQRNIHYKESFETRVLTMIQIHRDNVREMLFYNDKLDYSGRICFLEMIEAYKKGCAYFKKRYDTVFPQKDLSEIPAVAYCALYYGYDSAEFETVLRKIPMSKDEIKVLLDIPRKDVNLPGLMARGNQVLLGHYYRHLFQTVKFIDGQAMLSQDEKYDYAKMLRAQLSTDEQALLFLNSLSPLGKEWRMERRDNISYMNKYRLIKNIPSEYFSKNLFGPEIPIISPKQFYPDIKFEYEE